MPVNRMPIQRNSLLKTIFDLCILFPNIYPAASPSVSGRVIFLPPPQKVQKLVTKLVYMKVEPIQMGVPLHSSLLINRHSLSVGRSIPPTGRMFRIRNSKSTSSLIRMGYGRHYLPGHMTRKMTHMGTTSCVENRYNPATGFSTGKGSFRIIHLTVALMITNPAIYSYTIRNHPVVFRGGGFAGRAGGNHRGLRFASSTY
jgi:hypothetical protein